nr:hypothetical protein [Nocardia sp. CC227C]
MATSSAPKPMPYPISAAPSVTGPVAKAGPTIATDVRTADAAVTARLPNRSVSAPASCMLPIAPADMSRISMPRVECDTPVRSVTAGMCTNHMADTSPFRPNTANNAMRAARSGGADVGATIGPTLPAGGSSS